jgi:hypothetical protein
MPKKTRKDQDEAGKASGKKARTSYQPAWMRSS